MSHDCSLRHDTIRQSEVEHGASDEQGVEPAGSEHAHKPRSHWVSYAPHRTARAQHARVVGAPREQVGGEAGGEEGGE